MSTVARRRIKQTRHTRGERADEAFRIGCEIARMGVKVRMSDILRRMGYASTFGHAGVDIKRDLQATGRWPITPEMAAGIDTGGEPVERTELETLTEIKRLIEGLSLAARGLVKTWL